MCIDKDYIVRIISLRELKDYVLPERGTFHLRSTISYRDLSSERNGDPCEMEYEGKDFTVLDSDNYLISCWSYLGNNNNPEKFFDSDTNKERNDVAIVSTIDKVVVFLKNIIGDEYFRREIFAELEHKKVEYDNKEETLCPVKHEEKLKLARNLVFKKDSKFKNQNEYRFAIREIGLKRLHSFIFYAEPKDYIEGIWINRKKYKDNQGIIAALLAIGLDTAVFKNGAI